MNPVFLSKLLVLKGHPFFSTFLEGWNDGYTNIYIYILNMTGKGLWEWPSAQMAKPPLKMVGMWKSAPSLMLNSLHKTLTSQVGE